MYRKNKNFPGYVIVSLILGILADFEAALAWK